MKKSVMSGLLRVLVCVGMMVTAIASFIATPEAKAEEAQLIPVVYRLPNSTPSELREFLLARAVAREGLYVPNVVSEYQRIGLKKVVVHRPLSPPETVFTTSLITLSGIALKPAGDDVLMDIGMSAVEPEVGVYYRLNPERIEPPGRTAFVSEYLPRTGWGNDRFSYALAKLDKKGKVTLNFNVWVIYPVTGYSPSGEYRGGEYIGGGSLRIREIW